jgi:hypothetical protein
MLIGLMGTTGPASGVHLHTSAENPPIASTPPRLAGKGGLTTPDLTCYEPMYDDTSRSTNVPPPP